MKIAVILIALVAFSTSAFGQEEQSGAIKTDKGILVVWNEPGNYYTIEIKGNKITPTEQPRLFSVDGKFFQIQTAPKKEFMKDSKTLDDKAILTAHRDWEHDYVSKLLNIELKVESEWLTLPGGQEALAWGFDMPKVIGSQTAKRQIFLTVVKRDHVFVLNSAITDLAHTSDAKMLLLESMQTMKSSDKPLSLKKASEQIRKGN